MTAGEAFESFTGTVGFGGRCGALPACLICEGMAEACLSPCKVANVFFKI